MLTVQVAADGHGFDPTRSRQGAGLGHIRDRVETVGSRHALASSPGRGTVLTISLPWSRRRPRIDRRYYVGQRSSRLFRRLVLAVVGAAGAIALLTTQTTVALTLAAASFTVLAVCATRAAERQEQDSTRRVRARRVIRARPWSVDSTQARLAASPADRTHGRSPRQRRSGVPSRGC
jgi:hypothetical protein